MRRWGWGTAARDRHQGFCRKARSPQNLEASPQLQGSDPADALGERSAGEGGLPPRVAQPEPSRMHPTIPPGDGEERQRQRGLPSQAVPSSFTAFVSTCILPRSDPPSKGSFSYRHCIPASGRRGLGEPVPARPQPGLGHSRTTAAGDTPARKDSEKHKSAPGCSLLPLQRAGLCRSGRQRHCHGFTDKEQTELQKKGMGIPAVQDGDGRDTPAPVCGDARALRSSRHPRACSSALNPAQSISSAPPPRPAEPWGDGDVTSRLVGPK